MSKVDLRVLIELLRAESPRFVARQSQVFCNRNLKMHGIEAIGFDMDYTLAPYHQEAIDRLSHEKTLERLISERGYPESILSIGARPRFAIRGLCVDKELGTIFKMDAHRYVGKVYRGFQELTHAEREVYHRMMIRFTDRFHLVDTLFALPEAFLLAALTEHLSALGVAFAPGQLFEDIRHCIDLAHRDNSIKTEIMSNIERFIVRDPLLAPTLHRLRSAGKRLFLLTNSFAEYTIAVMSYLLDGVLSEYPSWRNYFDVIVTGAAKPFFLSGTAPFLKLDEQLNPIGEEHERLQRGRIYQGGNLVEFERLLGSSGPTVLYVGDHIYGDILRSKRASAWRTCMIVQEMDEELGKTDTLRLEISERNELEQELDRINDEVYFIGSLERQFDELIERLSAREAEAGQPGSVRPTDDELRRAHKDLQFRQERLKRRRRRLIEDITRLAREIEQNFNPYWGLVFKEGNELSIFGKQVQDYACLYTSRVSNLAAYSPLHHYRAPVELLPHEL